MPLKEGYLKELIKDDKDLCYTPDLPTLRFRKKPISVFIWDNLQRHADQRKLLSHVDDKAYTILFYSAVTTEKYFPIRNTAGEDKGYYGYLLRGGGQTYGLDWPAKKIQGKLMLVNREVLEVLDYHYYQGDMFLRQKTKIIPSVYKPKEYMEAFIYLNPYKEVFDLKKGVVHPEIKAKQPLLSYNQGESYYAM
jgi:hypothetical protein